MILCVYFSEPVCDIGADRKLFKIKNYYVVTDGVEPTELETDAVVKDLKNIQVSNSIKAPSMPERKFDWEEVVIK